MPNDIEKGSETTEEVITTPEEAIKAGEEGPSEEKVTPAPSSEEKKPVADSEEDSDEEEDPDPDASEEEEEGEPDADSEEDDAEDGDGKQPDLSTGGEDQKVLKPVPGETPREFALRKELKRKSDLLRKERGQKLLSGTQPHKTVAETDLSDEDKKVLESFDPEQLANQEKLFGVLAKKNGYVKKDDLSVSQYKETSQAVLDDWMEKHPEYSEDKDPDGILWKRFAEEFQMYKPPANPKEHTKIFNRIHNDIFGITTQEKGKETFKKAKAQQQKVNTASAGASATTPRKLSDRRVASAADPELSKVARSGALKGFTDEELAEMGL